ncbi:hypothetical protein I307_02623 [Cryptococcus deuterogattii 99/473]|uniref:Mitochondrial import inner membrane translocase subunit Tim21 n=2 Tax=Cryptococcus deuterogattii TaxID=1859096 RepID=A0A0D0UWV5_9TREE|nr:hypothetical protein CNBG_3867 [Cryptococcus deuterogattii R265]KIR28059.1 hypothetical protein I309_03056 [Cryptococcus deuterogattii LA55]KIR32596.1 hypothetical protein I352_05021 [Cryptococcus deuterogattii MMRL2647]KIR39766.1 hypothetical protein I313_04237 [Cryptococcus deuterogattii Ram5]KIR70685.1 hypothetical protein I310_05536 [Cryptococcus deuterogattii CA1014]KIR90736.1 hypothetical protein I304_05385 [Cryptococcus deuterogattii CBS 10090]KIY57947.1 hypothetical protein I307_02
MSRPVSTIRLVLSATQPRFAPSPAIIRPFVSSTRLYATHRETVSPHSQSQATSDLLKGLGNKTGTASGTQDTVGPFPLGVGPNGRRKTWKSWSDLNIGGKLVRTTQQTGNLTVILFGGALFVVLAFALTTELFAKNSPSVLYSRAIDMIRGSNALDAYLLPPLKFTHSPHSSAPVRGSPPIAHTFIRNPTSGKDHLVISFWIHGRGKDEEETLGWIKQGWRSAFAWGKQGVEMLVGEKPEDVVKEDVEKKEKVVAKQEPGMLSRWFGGLNLRSPVGSRTSSAKELPPAGTYTVGEARGEYVKDEAGEFQMLSLIVDIPSSKVSYPGRAVIFQSPEAETEGLLGKRIR